jgi:hypothetical protein
MWWVAEATETADDRGVAESAEAKDAVKAKMAREVRPRSWGKGNRPKAIKESR